MLLARTKPSESSNRLPRLRQIRVEGQARVLDYEERKEETWHKCCRKGHSKGLSTQPTHRTQIGMVQESEGSNPWSVTLPVNGRPVDFKIDTGADVTVISKIVNQNIPHSTLKPPTKTLRGGGGK